MPRRHRRIPQAQSQGVSGAAAAAATESGRGRGLGNTRGGGTSRVGNSRGGTKDHHRAINDYNEKAAKSKLHPVRP